MDRKIGNTPNIYRYWLGNPRVRMILEIPTTTAAPAILDGIDTSPLNVQNSTH
jgi:hypothetical protein